MNNLNANYQRLSFGWILAGIITLLLIAATGLYWLPHASKTITPISQPGASMFVSRTSPAMISLLVNPQELQSLDREFTQAIAKLLAKNITNDIQSWLGKEISLVVTTGDLDRNPDNGMQPGYLMILATEDPTRSREFIKLLFSQRALSGKTLEVSKYNGTKLVYDLPGENKLTSSQFSGFEINSSLAGAVVGKYVLFANDIKVLKESINNVQAPNLNLLSSPKYQKAIQEMPKNALALGYFNLPYLAKWQNLHFPGTSISAKYDSQLISLVLNPDGLLVETGFFNSSPVPKREQASMARLDNAVSYLPESVGLVISGINLQEESGINKLWQQATTTIYGSPTIGTRRLLPHLWEVQEQLGISLADDIFSWIDGEYALGIFPSLEDNTHWTFIVENSPSLIQGIARLNTVAVKQGCNISSFQFNGQTIFAWTKLKFLNKILDTQIIGLHTTVNKYEIFASDILTMQKILTHEENPLTQNHQFNTAAGHRSQTNQGYVYIDWQKSQRFLESQQPLVPLGELFAQPLFKNLRSLTISNYGHNPGMWKGGVFFQVKD
ncbi:DUF3352 domain-containing protein [Cylindrospermopsis curvispora]|uniref:DUF3352 domain-containing protein n=1 Tax=Cylindrospermopsis curvispora GIHE-G1 TaxID=2666332 RepID=A0A7H0F2Q9_9CYAN|nr:DUF3352 domain-containing protein [Cylindrospermopsis curvispora]QNP30325.1 DUF3352 domain-containing protein [Cylindrospermopsis curvispora GIHE-G1]